MIKKFLIALCAGLLMQNTSFANLRGYDVRVYWRFAHLASLVDSFAARNHFAPVFYPDGSVNLESLNALNPDSKTLLMVAAEQNNSEVVMLLLCFNEVNLHVQSRRGMTALLYAVETGSVPLVQRLLRRGALLHEDKAAYGATALHLAVRLRHTDMVHFLVASGLDMNAQTQFGETALHFAGHKNFPDLVRYLLERGASPNIRDSNKKTALWWAAYSGYAEVAEVLLQHRADPNACTSSGMRPLHQAAYMKHAEMVRLLLRYGARTDVTDINGYTPYDYACRVRDSDCILLLSRK